jgi:hypothetical protein
VIFLFGKTKDNLGGTKNIFSNLFLKIMFTSANLGKKKKNLPQVTTSVCYEIL